MRGFCPRQWIFQSSASPVATPAIITSPTQENDPLPFKLYRGGADNGTSYVGGSQIGQFATFNGIALLDALQSGDAIKVVAAATGSYRPMTSSDPGAGCFNFTRRFNVASLTVESLVPGTMVVIDHSVVSALDQTAGGDGMFMQMGELCTDLRVRWLDVTGARNSNSHDGNFVSVKSGANVGGAGVHKSHAAVPFTLTVENCALRRWTNGILTLANWNGTVVMRRSLVEDCTGGNLSHGLYMSEIASFTAEGTTFRTTAAGIDQPNAGHLLKSRARATTIDACLFDGVRSARCMDISNGGALTVRGVVLKHDDTVQFADSNQLVRFGAEQSPFFYEGQPDPNFTYDGRTHSILFEQNAASDNQTPAQQLLRIDTVYGPSNNVLPVSPQTVRGNIVAGASAAEFISLYGAESSEVLLSQIDANGKLTIDPIAGSNADATKEYVGVLQAPITRSDTYRGAFSPLSLPTWRVGQAVGEWRDLGTKPQDAYIAAWGVAGDGGLGATSGPRDAIGAWCGAAKFGTKVVHVAPGGHAGYYGNWSAGVDLSLGTPLYVQIAPTSTFANVLFNSKLYADGRPPSAHTYSATVPMPSLNRVFRMGSSAVAGSDGGSNFGNINSLNVGAGTYEADSTYAECPASIATDAVIFQDPVTYDVYAQTAADVNTLRRYNVASNTWSLIWAFNGNPPTSPTLEKQSSGVDTRRRRVLLHRLQPFYPTAGGPCLVNLPIAPQSGGVNDQSGITQCTFSGPSAEVINASTAAGWAFVFMPHPTDPNQDYFYARRQWAGGLIYRIKAVPDGSNQLFCEEFVTTGGALLPDGYGGTAGIYNKMQAFPEYGGIFIVIEYEKNAHFLRTI